MTENLLNTSYLAAAFLALFGSAELLYHQFKVKAEVTRKYVHIVTGLLTMLFPILIVNHWLVMALCGSFLFILLASLRFNKLPSINGVTRISKGSILYPIVVYACYLVFTLTNDLTYFFLPILLLALCDPLAAFVGKRFPWKPYTTFGNVKTLSGSLAFFISAFAISLIFYSTGNPFISLLISLALSTLTTLAEAVTHKGYDNLTIPATAVATLLLMGALIE